MSRYGLVWLEIAREHYASLPAAVREQIDLRIEQLLENPRRQPRSAYDETTDQWTTTYGGGAGLIVYAVVHERQRLIILRLV
jgi:mRNA-degrading endonuclease RelE of RelBE toxin-antitoxin system